MHQRGTSRHARGLAVAASPLLASPSAVHHRRSRSDKAKRGSNLGESQQQQQQRVEALAPGRSGARAMAAGRGFLLLLFTAAVLVGLASASPFISDSVFQGSAGSTGRSLLQAKKSCPMNFEFQNYTIITSQCKGPKFPAKECCGSFKEFACPFNTYINDESNDCASTMFSYINLYGKYPPGLFAHECREGKLGLSCDGVPQREVVASGGQRAQGSMLALITLVCGLLSLLFH